MRQRPTRRILTLLGCCVVAAALVVPLGGTPGSATAATNTEATTVPVKRCRTSSQGAPGRPSPSSITVSLLAAAFRGLVFYSNGYLTLLAPAGWKCRGVVGADGFLGMTISNPAAGFFNQRGPGPGPGRIAQEAVTAYVPDTPGPVGQLACTFFPHAHVYIPDPSRCNVRPAGEKQVRSARRVLFQDPPHVAGNGTPSGGRNPANGVAAYTPDTRSRDAGAMIATCTLPEASHSRCTTILNDFLRRWPRS